MTVEEERSANDNKPTYKEILLGKQTNDKGRGCQLEGRPSRGGKTVS